MILEAKPEQLPVLSVMLRAMYEELFGDKASKDNHVYISAIVAHFNNPKDYVYIDDKARGFFVIRDETEDLAPEVKRYHGLRVYIHPQFRKGRLLSEFYAKLFKEFPDGDIIGTTEINSEHIAVLEKRHTRIANMYKLNRGKDT